MTLKALQKRATEKNEILITRIVNAPRELVFDCWTKAEHLERWYFPNSCTAKFTRVDLRVGGGFHAAIITPSGEHCWCRSEYKEIVRPEKLVFTLERADEKGNYLSPADAGMPHEWPDTTLVTLIFEDLGDQTRFTLYQTVDLDLATRTGAYPSWLQMLDRMETLISK